MREVCASAPGRVNLIGEHTDYHDGFVLPCAVVQRTEAVVRLRSDRRVRAISAAKARPIEYELGRERQVRGWADYIQGLTWVLAQEGHRVGGFELRLGSDLPLGSGLSSSAALEVATLRALRQMFALEIADVPLARLAQRAEVEFVGAPVGIMDHMASSLAGERDALFLDTRTLHFAHLPLPHALELVIINSGVTHRHAVGDYLTRRRESEQAARLLGVEHLRDAPADALERLTTLPPTLARRARHVITENGRVLEATQALRTGDLPALGRLFSASHASLRDDYEVSVPEVDLLVALAEQHDGVHGARLTGGGFGGAIVIAANAGCGAAIAADTAQEYERRTGRTATILAPRT
ncbi:MAG: galactokinase [Vicinamibacterales bacterium]